MLKGINMKLLTALGGNQINKKIVEYHAEMHDNSFIESKQIQIQNSSMSKVKKVNEDIVESYSSTLPLGVTVHGDKLANHMYLGEGV